MALYKAYKRCRKKKKVSKSGAKRLFKAYTAAREAKQEAWRFEMGLESPAAKKNGKKKKDANTCFLTPDQRRWKRREEVKKGTSSSWANVSAAVAVNGATGMRTRTDKGTMKGSLRSSNGRFTLTLRFSGFSAGDLLKQYIDTCDKQLGVLIACTMDRKLRSKPVQGALKLHSVEEGLDEIARLAGGKLEKTGEETWTIK